MSFVDIQMFGILLALVSTVTCRETASCSLVPIGPLMRVMIGRGY